MGEFGVPMGSIYDDLWRRRRSLQPDVTKEETTSPTHFRYHTNEMSFDRPAVLKDKSLHMLTLNESGPSPFSLMITRGSIDEEETLSRAAFRIAEECEKVMHDPTIIEPATACQIGEVDAMKMSYKWHQNGMLLHQKHYLVIRNDEYNQRLLIQFTATSNSPTGFSTTDKELINTLLNSIQWRQIDKA